VTDGLPAEQLSSHEVPVFAADAKGDLSGLATPGAGDDRLLAVSSLRQEWKASAFPVEFLALGGVGQGVPVRATMTAFGPTLLAKALDPTPPRSRRSSWCCHHADKARLVKEIARRRLQDRPPQARDATRGSARRPRWLRLRWVEPGVSGALVGAIDARTPDY
jgi:hypothetical protein